MNNRITRLITIVTIMSSLFLLVYYYFYLIFPFIIAGIITLFMEPIVSFIEIKLKIKRIWSTFLVLSSFIIIFTFFFFMIGKLLLNEASALIYHATDYLHSFKQLNKTIDSFVQTITDWFRQTFPFFPHVADLDRKSTRLKSSHVS